jgi:hypothetical protein
VRVLRTPGLVGVLLACWLPLLARADAMDPALERLVQRAGNGPCAPTSAASVCPDDEAFEHLASELAVSLAPPIASGAATTGPRGFYVGVSSTATPIRSSERYWAKGTRGASLADEQNRRVDGMLAWNRLDVRKGLPFGFELGSSLGYGVDTSLWLLSAELRVAVFEGFHTGLGALPDVALRGATQAMFGTSELSVRTHTLDLTISKPFVVAVRHRVTPLLALQALFVNAKSGRVDLTPGSSAWNACAPTDTRNSAGELDCSGAGGAAELANTRSFRSVNQTRVRLFVGAEERYGLLSVTATLGFDLAVPQLQTDIPGNGPNQLMRQISFHLACGLRY